MNRVVRVPVKVISDAAEREATLDRQAGQASGSQVPQPEPQQELRREGVKPADAQGVRETPLSQAETDWCDRALRLQAEMENYRKRQQRWAEEEIRRERERLLRAFLPTVDDLDRALAAPTGDSQELRRGIELVRRSALDMLAREGVEPIDAVGAPFDPAWHEAVATRPTTDAEPGPGIVAEVLQGGYRIEDQLLRPAKVIVTV